MGRHHQRQAAQRLWCDHLAGAMRSVASTPELQHHPSPQQAWSWLVVAGQGLHFEVRSCRGPTVETDPGWRVVQELAVLNLAEEQNHSADHLEAQFWVRCLPVRPTR